MNKKGQAALEFLTTYGWAFLVILIMIGALSYFGVLNPTKYVPESCTFASPFQCDDAVIMTNGDVTMKFRNNGEALVITEFSIVDMDDGTNVPIVLFTANMAAGGIQQVTQNLGGTLPAGVKKKISVHITYYYATSTATFTKSTGGDIVGTVQ
ncbi:MAG: hypothetical protein KJ583_06015 [Nanoarchaeota archaeon]|nr:hypothetical protein [Nanoarchaeota archaeon]MBU1270257.1 hypothetical protein [Nanoarchaeota archaeon]MBU1604841.1 hypothetical protein [Nanoarchaeota archaeon]MBU2442489.1 hypothetical protein [Nanoarchaeota archaeon]